MSQPPKKQMMDYFDGFFVKIPTDIQPMQKIKSE